VEDDAAGIICQALAAGHPSGPGGRGGGGGAGGSININCRGLHSSKSQLNLHAIGH
jgi:hypothetical protein